MTVFIMAVVMPGGNDLALEVFGNREEAEARAVVWVNNPGNGATLEVAKTFEEACEYAQEQNGEWISISQREVSNEAE